MSSDSREPKLVWPGCKIYDGTRSPHYDDYVEEVGCIACTVFENNDTYDHWQVCLGLDQGGDAAAAPAMPGAGVQLQGALAKRDKRQGRVRLAIRETISDTKIKQQLARLAPGDVGGQGVGRRAWLLVESACKQPADDKVINNIKLEFAKSTILGSVGYDAQSIAQYALHLGAINAKFTAAANQFSPQEVSVKLLTDISREGPLTIAGEASQELRRVGATRRFFTAATGDRDPAAITSFFQGMWEDEFNRPNSQIRKRPRQADGRTDGTALAAQDRDAHDRCRALGVRPTPLQSAA